MKLHKPYDLLTDFLYGEHGRNFRMPMWMFYLSEPMYAVHWFWKEKRKHHSFEWCLKEVLSNYRDAKRYVKLSSSQEKFLRIRSRKYD